jgi:hypothetical protein
VPLKISDRAFSTTAYQKWNEARQMITLSHTNPLSDKAQDMELCCAYTKAHHVFLVRTLQAAAVEILRAWRLIQSATYPLPSDITTKILSYWQFNCIKSQQPIINWVANKAKQTYFVSREQFQKEVDVGINALTLTNPDVFFEIGKLSRTE